MCYSAMVNQKLKSLGLRYQARVDFNLFKGAFERRSQGEKIRMRRGLELSFKNLKGQAAESIWSEIQAFQKIQVDEAERAIFENKKRLSEAERSLAKKVTKSAEKELGVASRQLQRALARLKQLQTSGENDLRIYPMDWAPVIIWSEGQRSIVPMRYHLRPPHMHADFDRKYPGCYNARRDSLEGFWKNEFGQKHGIIILSSFFENVKRHDLEKRPLTPAEAEENVVIQFTPKGVDEMVVPIIWDTATAMDGSPSFDSFAIITDEPPPEVLDTGHDRCPIFLKPENIDAWLNPKGKTSAELFALLDDKERPYYEYQIEMAG